MMIRENSMPDFDHTPDSARRDARLREELIGWLATMRPDGRPHLVPIWFYWTGQELIVTAEPGSQKIKNLLANPRASLSLDNTNGGKEPIMIEGRASIDATTEDNSDLHRYFEKYRNVMAQMNWSEVDARRSHSAIIRIAVDRFVTF